MNNNKLQNGVLYRPFQIDSSAIDIENRSVTISVASGKPYLRGGAYEILEISEKSVRAERLINGVVPLLFNHTEDELIGALKSFKIQDGVLYCTYQFGTTQDAEDYFTLVKDGVLKSTSCRYIVYGARVGETIDGIESYIVDDMEFLESSLVPIPADPTVGVGFRSNESDFLTLARSLTSDVNQALEAVVEANKETEEPEATTAANTETEAETNEGTVTPESTEITVEVTEKPVEPVEAQKSDSTTPEDKNSDVVSRAAETQQINDIKNNNKGNIKMNILDLVRSLVNKDGKAQEYFARGAEHAKANGLDAIGNQIVMSDFSRAGEQVVSTPELGGYVAPSTYRPDMIIEDLVPADFLTQLGITRLSVNGRQIIPISHKANSAYWADEIEQAGLLTKTYGEREVVPHRVTARVLVSRRAARDTNPNVLQDAIKEAKYQIQSALQKVLVYGDGVKKPVGILNSAGVQTIGNLTGAAPKRSELLAMKKKLAKVEAKASGILVSESMACDMEGVEISPNTAKFLLENGKALNFPVATSNDIADDIVIMGDFNQVALIDFGMLDIVVNEQSLAGQNLIEIVFHYDVDVLVKRGNHFVTATAV